MLSAGPGQPSPGSSLVFLIRILRSPRSLSTAWAFCVFPLEILIDCHAAQAPVPSALDCLSTQITVAGAKTHPLHGSLAPATHSCFIVDNTVVFGEHEASF